MTQQSGPTWNVFRVHVDIACGTAGAPAIQTSLKYAILQGKASKREEAVYQLQRSQDKEALIDAASKLLVAELSLDELVQGLMETMPTVADQDDKEPCAVFRRCKAHGAPYISGVTPRAVFQDCAASSSKWLKATPHVVATQMQFWPGVLHLYRNGEMVMEPDGVLNLRGTPMGNLGPRSITQHGEAVENVTIEFYAFALALGKAPGPVTAQHLHEWLAIKQNAFFPHRKMEGQGLVRDFGIEELGSFNGRPILYPSVLGLEPWERESFLVNRVVLADEPGVTPVGAGILQGSGDTVPVNQ